MGCGKNRRKVLAGILAVGMLASSISSAVHAAEMESNTVPAVEQEIAVPEEPGEEAVPENEETEFAGKEETGAETGEEAGSENEETGFAGKEETETETGEETESGSETGETVMEKEPEGSEDGAPETENPTEKEMPQETGMGISDNSAEIPGAGDDETEVETEDSLEEAEADAATAEDEAPTSGTCGENLTWRLEDGTLTISGTGEMEDYNYDIRPTWCSNQDQIHKVVIENGVTTIGAYAFWVCINLTSISIPGSVTAIGAYAFEYCSGLKNISIPNNVTIIGECAFESCSSLTRISIPNSVTTIEKRAFASCSGLTGGISIPSSVTTIGACAFEDCSGLTNISIPSSVTTIRYWTFHNCKGLTSITIPSSVTTIENQAFESCSGLTNISIPGSVTAMGEGVFYGCSGLTNITISSGVTTIENGTFCECSGLTSITIPDSVTSIKARAFLNADSLSDIYYGGSEKDWNAINIDSDNEALLSANIHYNTSNNLEWNIDVNGVLSIRGIGEMADYSYPDSPAPWSVQREEIKKVIISQGVTSIGASAFEGCTNLAAITIPGSVVSIGGGAFKNCSNLTDVTIPNSVTSIDWSAFYGCTSLTEVIIPNSMTRISGGMFYGCSNLTKITIPESIILIEANAFLGAGSLADVYYGGSESDWQDIDIRDGNEMLGVAAKHFNSAVNNPNDTSIRQKRVAFYSPLAKGTHTMTMYWGWDTFLKGSSVAEDYQLAEVALALSGAAERSQQSVESMLKDKLGFEPNMMWSQNYDKEGITAGYPGVTFSHKAILQDNGETVHIIAIVIRGTTTVSDYVTDADLLAGSGFDTSTDNVYDWLEQYIYGCSLNTGTITKNNVKFLVTGHSLGGVVANGVAKRLNDCYGSQNVFSYTFAAPKVIKRSDNGNNKNIHNILNKEDLVPHVAMIGHRYNQDNDIWFHRGDYGDRIYQNFYELTNGMDLKLGMFPLKKPSEKIDELFKYRHGPEIYMSFLMVKADKETEAPPPGTTAFFARLLSFKCPVDVEIYVDDTDGNKVLVGQIKNNQADNTLSCGMYTYVDGDKKYAYLLDEGEYTIKLYSTGEGTLTYTVQEIEVTNNQVAAEKVFANVALTDDKKMTSTVSVWDKSDLSIDTAGKTDTPNVRLLVLGGGDEPEKEVLPDGNGTEVPLAYGDILEEDIPADRNIPEGIWCAGVLPLSYTGKPVRQSFRIYDNKTLLRENRDYTVKYKNNTRAYEYTDADYRAYIDRKTNIPAHTDEGHYYDGFNPKKAPQIVVAMKGNYTGRRILYFGITRPDLGGGGFIASDIYVQYNGKKQTPAPCLMWNGKKLKYGTDFSVAEYDAAKGDKNAFKGTESEETRYSLTLVGKGNFSGTRSVTLTVIGKNAGSSPVLMDKIKVPAIPAQTYETGTAYTLANLKDKNGNALQFALKYKNYILQEGVDYEVASVTGNDRIGTAVFVLRGLNTGGTQRFAGDRAVTFQIVNRQNDKQKYSMMGADIQINGGEAITAAYLKGGAKPRVKVTCAGRLLVEGTDYTLKYTNNNAVTTPQTKRLPLVTIKGKGAFSGKVSKNYTITPRDFSDGILLLAADTVVSSKANRYAAKLTLMDTNGKTLKAGTDYDTKNIKYFLQKEDGTETLLTDKDNPQTGSRIRVEVTAKGNYSGSISSVYRIIDLKADISKAVIRIKNQEYTGKAVTITDASQFAVDKNGNRMVMLKTGTTKKMLTFGVSETEGVDLVAVPGSYVNNTAKGTAAVTFKGVGQYGGYRTVTFKIGAKSIGTVWEGIWNEITKALSQ